MGERTYVNQTKRRTSSTGAPAQWLKDTLRDMNPLKPVRNIAAERAGTDWVLLGTIAVLLLFGLLMVYSSGTTDTFIHKNPSDYFLWKQVIRAGIGLAAMWVLSRTPLRWIQRTSVLMMLGTIVLLIVTLLAGDTTNEAHRSLFNGSIRVSDVAKLTTIIYVAVWVNAKHDQLNQFSLGLFPLTILLGVTAGLIAIQPDFSAGITIFVLGILVYFLGGGELRQLVVMSVLMILIIVVVLNFYGMRRITEYIDGLHDLMKASEHMTSALAAIVNGRFWGVGLGEGKAQYVGLPVAYNDSIFAVIVEEVGTIGAGVLIVLYAIFLWRGLAIANHAKDRLSGLLAGGITIWIVFEAFLNMAVMTNLLPQVGNALPFISFGGSHLVTELAGVGIILGVARATHQDTISGGRSFGAVVDLRWRDRGRRVSRTGRTSSTR